VAAGVVVVELAMRPAHKRVGTGSSLANRGGHDARLMRSPTETSDGKDAGGHYFSRLSCLLSLHRLDLPLALPT
jgi:hypothetical protein